MGQLDQTMEYLRERKPAIGGCSIQLGKERYGKIKGVLLDADKRTMETVTRMYLKLIRLKRTDPHGHVQNPTQLSLMPLPCP